MDARLACFACAFAALPALGAEYRTRNFTVQAPTPEIARQVGEYAEHYRIEIAKDWLGQELLPWSKPCAVKVKVGEIGAGGATTFTFDRGQVFGWNMQIQGSLERILDSVLPHEVSHTIFACHFRRPLPRWADEGAATLVENESERMRQVLLVRQVLGTRKRIPLPTLLKMTEYPREMQDVMTLYAQGYSLCDMLVQRGGKTKYLQFLSTGMEHGWKAAAHSHYGYRGVEDLEKDWSEWVLAGSPPQVTREGEQLAEGNSTPAGTIVRGQSPEEAPPAADPVALALAEPSQPSPVGRPNPVSGKRGDNLAAPEPKRETENAVAEVVRLPSAGSVAEVVRLPSEPTLDTAGLIAANDSPATDSPAAASPDAGRPYRRAAEGSGSPPGEEWSTLADTSASVRAKTAPAQPARPSRFPRLGRDNHRVAPPPIDLGPAHRFVRAAH